MAVQYYVASSLDGFIATLEHSLDWLLQFGEPEEDTYTPFIREVGAVAMGSSTYEWVRRHLTEGQQGSARWPYEMPSWVFTTRDLEGIPGADLRFVRGPVRPVYRQMEQAAAGKNVWIVGGGGLAGQFWDEGLLDELIVAVTPVTLGAGRPLLPRAITSPPLRLVSARALGQTFVELRYEVSRQ
jgi:dihydrofolate reductase